METNVKETSDSRLQLDQDIASVEDLLNQITPYLISVKNESGSWLLKSFSTKDQIYYGMAGGLAGVGMKLLQIHELDTTLISTETQDTALDLALEIGDFLNNTATTNATGSFWTIGSHSNVIDLSYDFGIAGISVFFAKLANITQDADIEAIALRGLDTINALAEFTNGLHFNSSLYAELETSAWYPTREMKYYTSESYTSGTTYFNGKALGSLGVGHAALEIVEFLQITDNSSIPFKLVNATDQWLRNQKIVDTTEFSFSMSQPSFGLVSTSKAYGAAGALDFYLDLYAYTSNSSYLTEADGYFDFLNGTSTGLDKYQDTLFVNGSVPLTSTTHLGISHGIAGILQSLDYYLNTTMITTFDEDMVTLIYRLHNFGIDDGDYIRYPERIEDTSAQNPGSLSYSFGGGGILPIIADMVVKYSIENLDNDISKAKAYVYTRIGNFNGYQVLDHIQTQVPEVNPSIGFLSNYPLFFIQSEGELSVTTTSIDFGRTQVGTSYSRSIVLTNIGDTTIDVTWTDLSSSAIFIPTETNTQIEGRSSYSLSVSFIPTDEDQFSETFTIISASGEEYTIILTGVGYDLPQLTLVTAKANNSQITSTNSLEFVVNATDTSEIQSVTFAVNGTTRNMETTVGSDLFSTTWAVSNLSNGTYIIEIIAEDTVGNTNKITLVYEIGIYEPPLQERIFSETTMYYLIGLTIVMIMAAFLITKKYKS